MARCEAGGCRSQHEDQAALGESDVRARAIAAGWREDVLGRLACPACQSKQGLFWVPAPPGVPVARPSAPAPPVPDVATGARRSGPRGGTARAAAQTGASAGTGAPAGTGAAPAGRWWPAPPGSPGRHRRG
ncbi:MAG: hypothetical protein J2P35_10695 [Actinobacteria bacterium]|nr:hypothetical protein [Actinomycetota bacterium]